MTRGGLRAVGVCLVAMLLWAGCDRFGSEEDEVTFDDVRIIISEGVEDVRFGDSREQVIRQFGQPDTGQINFFIYSDSTQAGLGVGFVKNSRGVYNVVDYFLIYEPYDGTTQDGIGIGTPLEIVQETYGEPKKTIPGTQTRMVARSDTAHVYCVEDKRLQFEMHADTVRRMGFGNESFLIDQFSDEVERVCQ